MKVTRVTKVYRPMRKVGNLLKDIFRPKESKHFWVRICEIAESKKDKKEQIKKIKEFLENRIKVYENN
jgi:hypothetical protein